MRVNTIGRTTRTAFLLLGSALVLFPLYMTIVIALKTPNQLRQQILIFPTNPRWQNFANAIEVSHFWDALTNSFIVTFSVVVLTVTTNAMVGYAIQRNMHVKAFRFLYFYFVSAMFIPFPVIMLPIVKQMSFLGMNNLTGLGILYIVYGVAFNTFLYVGYLKSVPKELDHAAQIDGAGVWTTFWHIIFPVMKPINATVAILTSLWVWNDFMLPLLILGATRIVTLPLAQFAFQSKYTTDYNLAFASYLLALTPMLLVYLIAQRWVIGGITQGSIKQ